jgi:hypothetical protein
MNIFKKKDKETAVEKQKSKNFYEKHKHNVGLQEAGLSAIRAMPKWQQKLIIKSQPKGQRQLMSDLIEGNTDLQEDIHGIVDPNKKE